MLVHIVQELAQTTTAWWVDGTLFSHLGHIGAWLSPIDSSLLAQYIQEDVFENFRNFLTNFIESGQAWALLIGLVLGYLIKSVFSYG